MVGRRCAISNHRHRSSGTSIVSHDRAEPDEFVAGARPSPGRLVSTWGSKIFTVLVIVAALMGLARFAFRVSKQGQELAAADQGGAGIIVRSEVLHIWLPRALVELARVQRSSGVIRTHESLRRYLELRGRERLWYAMTVRAFLANGEVVEMQFVRQPYSEPSLFPELLVILAVAAENSSNEQYDEYANASIHVLTEEVAKREARDVMAELQRRPYSLDGLERGGGSGGP